MFIPLVFLKAVHPQVWMSVVSALYFSSLNFHWYNFRFLDTLWTLFIWQERLQVVQTTKLHRQKLHYILHSSLLQLLTIAFSWQDVCDGQCRRITLGSGVIPVDLPVWQVLNLYCKSCSLVEHCWMFICNKLTRRLHYRLYTSGISRS